MPEKPLRLEREVKIAVTEAAAVVAALQREGAQELEGARLEDDRLFDDASASHASLDQVLRLRRKLPLDGSPAPAAVLTWKGPATAEGGVRVREEIEASVDDAEALGDILDRLGYRETFRYQKRRRLFRLDGALIAVDETPLGHFFEIEGSNETIRELARRLGHGPEDFLTDSYPALWRAARGPEARAMLLDDEDA